jgi:amidase
MRDRVDRSIIRTAVVLAALAALSAATPAYAQQARTTFSFAEATIADVHSAIRARRMTCRAVVAGYLARIDANDKRGAALNAIVMTNPEALAIADSLDRRFASTRALVGPLHCVPVIVKDNFETAGLQTTAGSLALRGWVPRNDATMVRQLKDAGAIVLAKSNMAELAFSPYETVSSILPGYTKNPYALDRVTAGSSGGTGASVAASFGVVGLGTDTGNSIRGPSAHNALVGIRSTMGLTSRAGVVPLNLASDIAGPMARTVTDAVAVFQVVVGWDPNDSVTVASRDRAIPDYAKALRRDGLKGARIGVLPQAYLTATTDTEVVRVFARAVQDLERSGATVVDSVVIPELDSLRRLGGGGCNPFKFDLERFIASRNDTTVPVKTIAELIRSRRFHPSVEVRLTAAQAESLPPERNPGCAARDRFREGLRAAVLRAMDANRLDAFVYPTWSNPPRLIGDLNTPHGDNNQLFSPSTGFPAITVPMGYTRAVLPAGLQFYGRPWAEETLIRLAYGYEQATRWRKPPRMGR